MVDARVRHPAVGDLGTPMMFGRTTYNHSPSDLKHYCMARNNTLNLRDLPRLAARADVLAKTVWFYLFTKPRPGRIPMSARATYAGLRGDFTGHRRYLAMTETRETVAVVVVTYNRAGLLARMLGGPGRVSSGRPDAVIVVDNASTDHTTTVLDGGVDLPCR